LIGNIKRLASVTQALSHISILVMVRIRIFGLMGLNEGKPATRPTLVNLGVSITNLGLGLNLSVFGGSITSNKRFDLIGPKPKI